MAATNRKPLTFNVGIETYNHVAGLFPNSSQEGKPECSEATFLALLNAYEHPAAGDPNAQNTIDELTQRIRQLEDRVTELTNENSSLKTESEELANRLEEVSTSAQAGTEAQATTIAELTAERDRAQRALEDLQGECEKQTNQIHAMQVTIDELSAHPADPEANISGHLDEFTSELLEVVTERLRERTKTEGLTRMQVLIDGFLKYNIQQYNLWFYEFVITKQEILDMAHKYNPQIDSYRKLQKALGINE